MAVAGGPNLSENGLVFYYDTDNGKSYKGEPTTNFADTLSTFTTDGSGQVSIGTKTQVDGSNNHYRIVDVNSNTRLYKQYTSFTAGQPHTFSVEYKRLAGAPTLRFQVQGRAGSVLNSAFPTTTQLGVEDIDGWQRISYTFTPDAGSTSIYWFIQDGDDYTTYTHSYEIRNPQLEQKSHATPYVNGTRSATESLYDFISDTALDVSNVSFDANADITFDGTDDYVQRNPLNLDVSNGLSYEVVYSADSTYNTWGTYHYLLRFVGTTHYGLLHEGDSRGWRFDVPSSAGARLGVTTNNPNATAGAGYYHVAVSFDPVTGGKGYLNGVEIGSWAGGYIPFTPSSLLIGAETLGTRFWDGDIPLVKVYNRALTAQEVENNFNGIRSRFGI